MAWISNQLEPFPNIETDTETPNEMDTETDTETDIETDTETDTETDLLLARSCYRCFAQGKLNIQRWILCRGYVLNFPNGRVRSENVGPHFALYLIMTIVVSN